MIYRLLQFRSLKVFNVVVLLLISLFAAFLITNPSPLLLLAIIGAMVATIILLNPMAGFAIAFIYYPLYMLILSSSAIPKSIVFAATRDFLFILYLFSLFVGIVLHPRRKTTVYFNKQEFFLICFIIYSTLILMYYERININSISDYRYYSLYPLLVIISKYYFRRIPDGHKLLGLVVVGCSSIFALIGILQYIGLISPFLGKEAISLRYYGVRCIPGYFVFSTLVGVGIIFLFNALFDQNRRKFKKLISVLLFLHVVSLILSFVIASWVAIMASMLYVVFFNVQKKKIITKFPVVLLALILVIFVGSQAIQMIGGKGIMDTLALTNPYESGLSRLGLWHSYGSRIFVNPFGIGFGKFAGAYGSEVSTEQLLIADGGFLRIFYSTGFLGITLYLSFFYFQLRTLVKLRKRKIYEKEVQLSIMLTIFFVLSSFTRDVLMVNHIILPLYLLYGKLNALDKLK